MIKSPHPALDLSFMRKKTKAEGGGIAYWNVETTGNVTDDYERGRALGIEYLAYIGKHPTNSNITMLGCIVLDMTDRDGSKALKLGFLGMVNGYAMATAKMVYEADREVLNGKASS